MSLIPARARALGRLLALAALIAAGVVVSLVVAITMTTGILDLVPIDDGALLCASLVVTVLVTVAPIIYSALLVERAMRRWPA